MAGQVPLDAQSRLVGADDPNAQARQCLENFHILLKYHNFRLEDIRKLVMYVVGGRENLAQAWDAVTSWFDSVVGFSQLINWLVIFGITNELPIYTNIGS